MKSKKLIGGDINENNIKYGINRQIQNFIGIVILGYFSIKIVFPMFFNFYPQKYYFRNIEINSNEKCPDGSTSVTQAITLNAYLPGMWNNEVSDFVTLVILIYIIFIFTSFSAKTFIGENGQITMSFLFGYILGLSYPVFIQNYFNLYNKEINNSWVVQATYLILLLFFASGIVVLNYLSIDENGVNKINYIVYILSIVLVLSGLYISRKQSENYNLVRYFYGDQRSKICDESCPPRNGILQTSGDILNITVPFAVFILLLLFAYEPSDPTWKNLYCFVYALLLGILVSSISYFGFQYFLEKVPKKECSDLTECQYKKMPSPDPTAFEVPALPKNPVNPVNVDINQSKGSMSIINMILLILIILVIFYLIYYYFK
jgi:hypothetical protein